MINSMTGFGYNEFYIDKTKFVINIKSVNSKYVDINLNLPSELYRFEESLIKIIKHYIPY